MRGAALDAAALFEISPRGAPRRRERKGDGFDTLGHAPTQGNPGLWVSDVAIAGTSCETESAGGTIAKTQSGKTARSLTRRSGYGRTAIPTKSR